MANQDNDYKWFSENQSELFKKYPNKFLIISDLSVKGYADTFDDAVSTALNTMKAGDFIIQQCLDSENVAYYYNKAVVFA